MTRNRSAVSPAMVTAVLSHPSLWATAVRQVKLLAPTGWWRRPPFLPVPDLLTYLRWCRAWPGAIDRR